MSESKKFKMPSPEEMEKEYGAWNKNPVLKSAASWGMPNDAKKFSEEDNLESFVKLGPHFKKASDEVFGSE